MGHFWHGHTVFTVTLNVNNYKTPKKLTILDLWDPINSLGTPIPNLVKIGCVVLKELCVTHGQTDNDL